MFLKSLCIHSRNCLGMTGSASAQLARCQPRNDPPPADSGKIGFMLRQDLFNRNVPNSLRSDYPGPSAQLGKAPIGSLLAGRSILEGPAQTFSR